MAGKLVGRNEKRARRRVFTSSLEEEVGFEPTVPYGTPDFESGEIYISPY